MGLKRKWLSNLNCLPGGNCRDLDENWVLNHFVITRRQQRNHSTNPTNQGCGRIISFVAICIESVQLTWFVAFVDFFLCSLSLVLRESLQVVLNVAQLLPLVGWSLWALDSCGDLAVTRRNFIGVIFFFACLSPRATGLRHSYTTSWFDRSEQSGQLEHVLSSLDKFSRERFVGELSFQFSGHSKPQQLGVART